MRTDFSALFWLGLIIVMVLASLHLLVEFGRGPAALRGMNVDNFIWWWAIILLAALLGGL